MPLTEILSPLPSVSLDQSIADYPVIRISHPKASAAIALHGAHLIEWTPEGEKPVIYTSPTAIFKERKAIRGGIPICWPWFNAHPSDSSKPSHGVARNRFWELDSAKEDESSVTLLFSLPASEDVKKLFEHDFSLTLEINIGTELHLNLLTKNTSEDTYRIGGALHSYFTISDIENVTLTGLENLNYIDTVGQEAVKVQNGPITISEEVDRIYIDALDSVTIHDPEWKRIISVAKSCSSTTVVWNPGPEKARELTDLPDDGYKNFVCVEAANARKDVVTLEPGQLTTLTQTITVESSHA